jgi:RNase P subunit RPR2
MGEYNIKKSKQLGMPYGTANGRLRKKILFHLLRKHKENFCFRCDQEIVQESDLSIEHKDAWLDKDISLFWDIGNIAFSHLSCNIKDRRTGKIESPEGFSWCSAHKGHAPISHFRKVDSNNRTRNGLSIECRSCDAKRKHIAE